MVLINKVAAVIKWPITQFAGVKVISGWKHDNTFFITTQSTLLNVPSCPVHWCGTKSDWINVPDYLMCVREHENQKFLHDVSRVDGKEVFQLVHRHESADLGGKRSANINSAD